MRHQFLNDAGSQSELARWGNASWILMGLVGVVLPIALIVLALRGN